MRLPLYLGADSTLKSYRLEALQHVCEGGVCLG